MARASLSVLAVVLAAALPAGTGAQDARPRTPPDLVPLMCRRGALLFEETFDAGAYAPEWKRFKGTYAVEDGRLRVAEVASDGHHPALSRKITESDVLIQFSFRFDGAAWLGVALDDKEHVARLLFRPDEGRLLKMSGIGPTTKGTPVDSLKLKFEPGRWYTALWEVCGNEMVAQVDGRHVFFGEAQGLDVPKSRLELLSGGQWAEYDAIKVWKAEPDEKWKLKKQILAQRRRKS